MDKLFPKENYFPLHHIKDIEKYLENMANQGLFLVKFKNNYWYFKKDEPKNISYAVTYTEKSETSETSNTPENSDNFYATNNVNGWQLVVTSVKMQIFANTDKEPTPSDKNKSENFNDLKSALNKMFLFPYLATSIAFLCMVMYKIYSVVSMPESNNIPFSILLCIMLSAFVIYNGYYVFDYIKWTKNSEKSIGNSGNIIEKNYANTQKLHFVFKTVISICFFSMIIFMPSHALVSYSILAIFQLIIILMGLKNLNNYLTINEFPKMASNIICFIYTVFFIILFTFLIIVSGMVSG